jgi:hypothetical protein
MNDNRYVQDGEECILSLYFNALGFWICTYEKSTRSN